MEIKRGPVSFRYKLSAKSEAYLRRIEEGRKRFRFVMPLAATIFAASVAVGAFTVTRNKADRSNHIHESLRTLVDELPQQAGEQFRAKLASFLSKLKQQLAQTKIERPTEQERDPELEEGPFVTQEDENRFCYVFVRNIRYDGAHVDIIVMGRAPRVSILNSELTLKADVESDLFFPNMVIPFLTFDDLYDILLARCMRLQDRPDELLR